jgi:hypothetical protein
VADDIGYGTGNGVLYQCQNKDNSYSWVEYYTPATYPHPLVQSGGDYKIIDAPENLVISGQKD